MKNKHVAVAVALMSAVWSMPQALAQAATPCVTQNFVVPPNANTSDKAAPFFIDTTGLDERPWIDEVGHPQSSSAKIQERYTRVDQYNMKLTVTVDDPKFYTKPWTAMTADLYWMKNQEFSESFCIPSEGIEYRDSLTKPSGIKVVK